MPVALRIVDDVSYAMRINHEISFLRGRAQYFAESWRLPFVARRIVNDVFICDADQS